MPFRTPDDYTLTDPSDNSPITIARVGRVWYDDDGNTLTLDLGDPALADVDRIVVDADMLVGAYTIDEAASVDGLARNVTVTVTATDTADTMGTVVVVGTDIEGTAITETITPVAGSTVAGTKAFLSITSVTGVGWVIDAVEGNEDRITVGFGNVIGLPRTAISPYGAVTAAAQVTSVILGAALVAVTATIDADDISECGVDGSAGTYNGSKALIATIRRS